MKGDGAGDLRVRPLLSGAGAARRNGVQTPEQRRSCGRLPREGTCTYHTRPSLASHAGEESRRLSRKSSIASFTAAVRGGRCVNQKQTPAPGVITTSRAWSRCFFVVCASSRELISARGRGSSAASRRRRSRDAIAPGGGGGRAIPASATATNSRRVALGFGRRS